MGPEGLLLSTVCTLSLDCCKGARGPQPAALCPGTSLAVCANTCHYPSSVPRFPPVKLESLLGQHVHTSSVL